MSEEVQSTQPLTEMSTRNLPRGEGQPVHKTDNLTAIYETTVYKMWAPQHLTKPVAWPLTVTALPFYLYQCPKKLQVNVYV
jgi:hypothetical protein